jgi:hypothetical protein
MNSKAANSDFKTKQPIFKASKISMTSELGELSEWSAAAIEERQRQLAKLAVKAWPNKPAS